MKEAIIPKAWWPTPTGHVLDGVISWLMRVVGRYQIKELHVTALRHYLIDDPNLSWRLKAFGEYLRRFSAARNPGIVDDDRRLIVHTHVTKIYGDCLIIAC